MRVAADFGLSTNEVIVISPDSVEVINKGKLRDLLVMNQPAVQSPTNNQKEIYGNSLRARIASRIGAGSTNSRDNVSAFEYISKGTRYSQFDDLKSVAKSNARSLSIAASHHSRQSATL